MQMAARCAAGMIWLLAAMPVDAASTFTPAEIAEWPSHSFVGQTHYEYALTPEGRPAVYARWDGDSASGLFRREPIDLSETPVIEWRWRVGDIYGDIDETVKAGDDYPARIYIVDEHPLFPWRTRALAYVWSSAMEVGADWTNAYVEQFHMIAVASGWDGLGNWRTHRRNIREDSQRYHDRDVEEVDAIAIMSDCDDTGKTSEAWFGAIHLLPK